MILSIAKLHIVDRTKPSLTLQDGLENFLSGERKFSTPAHVASLPTLVSPSPPSYTEREGKLPLGQEEVLPSAPVFFQPLPTSKHTWR